MNQRDRKTGIQQRLEERTLQAASGFDDDASGCGCPQQFDDLADAMIIVADGQKFAAVGACQIELVLGDVDPDEQRRNRLRRELCHASIPALQMRAYGRMFASSRWLSRLFGRKGTRLAWTMLCDGR